MIAPNAHATEASLPRRPRPIFLHALLGLVALAGVALATPADANCAAAECNTCSDACVADNEACSGSCWLGFGDCLNGCTQTYCAAFCQADLGACLATCPAVAGCKAACDTVRRP